MALDIVYPLEQIHRTDHSRVGDKAFYLGLLLQQEYPVVPGIVLPAPVFRQFLEGINWLDPLFADLPNSSLHLNVNDSRQLQTIAQQLRRAIQSTPMPSAWVAEFQHLAQQWNTAALIVRPSFSLASHLDPMLSYRAMGLLSSHLCWADPQAIAQTIQRTWAELFRARSLLYWQRSGIQPQQINFAVLIQPIQAAVTAGHLQMSAQAITIQAAYGLGMGITEGHVLPDRYGLQRQTGQLHEHVLGSKTYAYQVADSMPCPATVGTTGDRLTSLKRPSPSLEAMLVDLEQRQKFCLDDSHLQSLVQLAQQVTRSLETDLHLEWMFPASGDRTHPRPLITQAMPQPRSQPSSSPESPPVAARLHLPHPPSPPLADEPWLSHSQADLLQGIPGSGGRVLGAAWVVQHWHSTLSDIPAGVVLIAPTVTPEQVSHLNRVAAIVTTQGGVTSHGAIVARGLGIPAVLGIPQAIHQIQTGEVLMVDGDRGLVQRLHGPPPPLGTHPADPTRGAAESETVQPSVPSSHAVTPAPTASAGVASVSSDPSEQPIPSVPLATQLLLNLSSADPVESLAKAPIDGVGLLRSELLLMNALGTRSPSTWLDHQQEVLDILTRKLTDIVVAFAPRPVLYRSLDLRSQDSHLGGLVEPNPTLGLHGTLSYQMDTRLFDLELTALRQVQQSGHDNLRLMLPFVRTVEEFCFCRDRIIQTGLTQSSGFQLWIMAEVPSILFLLPDYVAAGVQGISIGSNDLTQLLLAVDRDQLQMSGFFERCHPAVSRALQHLIQAARQAGIPCGICGQLPIRDLEFIDNLVRWGISSISVSADQIPSTHQAIARAEQRLLMEAIHQALPS